MNSVTSVRIGNILRAILLRMTEEGRKNLKRETILYERRINILDREQRWAIGDGDRDKELTLEEEKETLGEEFKQFCHIIRLKEEILEEMNTRVVRVMLRSLNSRMSRP